MKAYVIYIWDADKHSKPISNLDVKYCNDIYECDSINDPCLNKLMTGNFSSCGIASATSYYFRLCENKLNYADTVLEGEVFLR